MKHLILLFLALVSLELNAQYHIARVQMTDGSIKEGYCKLPSNKLLDNKVEFKPSKKGKVEKINDTEISKILITSKSGNNFLFERLPVVHLYKFFGKEIKQEKSRSHWMLLYHTNDKLNCYSLAQRYKIDKKGVMKSITGAQSIWEFIYFLLKRNEEEKAYIVSGIGFTNGQVRKAMSIYFDDIPEFVERVKSKEFKKSNVSDVADEYAKYFN